MSVHRLWLPNVEEFLPESDAEYSSIVFNKVFGIFPRFLLCLAPGDAIVTPKPLDREFCDYIAGVSGLDTPSDWSIEVAELVHPYSLARSIMADASTTRRLRELARSDDWVMEPYLQTPGVIQLAEAISVFPRETSPELVFGGLIDRLNDKGHFKELAKSLGIRVVTGSVAESRSELEEAIDRMSRDGCQHLMLRKAVHGGGYGNLAGEGGQLRRKIQTWYGGGRVLVEPYLNVRAVAGSLAYLSAAGCEFLGVDRQNFVDGKWNGFDFPYPPGPVTDQIQSDTCRIAEAVRAGGARGFMNLDWAITEESPEHPIVLECNFRHNGFGFILNFAQRYFDYLPEGLLIRYRETIPCNLVNTAALVEKMSSLRVWGRPLLIEGPGAEQGAIITTPPSRGTWSTALFSHSQEFMQEATARLEAEGLL